jgi:glucosylceramidase
MAHYWSRTSGRGPRLTPDRCARIDPGGSLQPGILFSAFTAVLVAGSLVNCGGRPATATPTFWPVAGTYSGTPQVAVRDTTSGATIYYTTDGSTPTKSSPVYTAPVTVSATTTVKALATSLGNDASSVASSDYTIVSGTAGAAVTSLVTTNDKAHKMDVHSGVSFISGTGSTNVIYVDETQAYQEIEGFGASFTDSAAYLLNQIAASTDRDTAIQDLFSPTHGIGLSFIRNPMGGSDIARKPYSYDDLVSGTDLTLTSFSIAHDLEDIVPLVQQAKNLNSDLKIMANPWSPPAWMKTTNSLLGKAGSTDSSLIATAENYTSFTNYLVKYIQAYAAQSPAIAIDYISLQNEPEYDPSDYAGMIMHADEQTTVLRDYVIPALASNSPSTKVLVWDHNWDNSSYPETVLSDTTIQNSRQVAGVSWHGYSGTPGVMTTLHNQHPALGQYVTEHSGDTRISDQVQNDFEEIIHTMRNWAKTYVKWSLALDENLGPRCGGTGTWTPLVTVNSYSGAVSYSIEYYTMGHFSRYVRPGAMRIYSNNAPGLVSAAFLNTDGSKALIVYNESETTRTFQVQWGSQVLTYSLPPKSGATFTWSGLQSGSYTMAGNAQIQASSYNDVINLVTETTSDTEGGYDLGYANNTSVAVFKNVDFGTGLTSLDARVASTSATVIECRLDGAAGTLVSSIVVPNTGGWQTWQTVNSTATGATGVHDLYLVFKGAGNLNWFKFK